jgi:lipid-binding SYLF domain-containing protein
MITRNTYRAMTACAAALVVMLAPIGCSSSDKSKDWEEPTTREDKAKLTIVTFKKADPGLQKFFDEAYGYAVFPSVSKGGLIVGGARGDGVVYEKGKVVGYSTLTQGTIGAQIGGQVFSEIIFFQDRAALLHFQRGSAELSAQATAVAAKAGVSAKADYADGVAVFITGEKGLMAEASVGGQGFSYDPK